MNEEIIERKGRINTLKHNINLMKTQVKAHQKRIKDIRLNQKSLR